VSGYDDRLSGLDDLDPGILAQAVDRLAGLAADQGIQRFVIACNVADPGQHCPSMIVSPRGEVLGDLPAGPAAVLRAVIDTQDVSDWYLSQRRTDVLRPARE
jgi:predicted amidohydrolase